LTRIDAKMKESKEFKEYEEYKEAPG